VETASETFDFLDFDIVSDIDEIVGSEQEDLNIRMALYNEGIGRAEVFAEGGDIASGNYIDGTECWDDSFFRQYFFLDLVEKASGDRLQIVAPQGAPESCTISDLNDVPSLDDIDDELLEILEDIAENGVPQD